jgi:hypothetical protein
MLLAIDDFALDCEIAKVGHGVPCLYERNLCPEIAAF